MTTSITIGGDPTCPGGVYVLRVAVMAPLSVVFGRFDGGRAVAVPAGDYLYVGSALGRRGATALAGRLMRHATRSQVRSPALQRAPQAASSPPTALRRSTTNGAGGREPHAIRAELQVRLTAAGLPAALPAGKRLHWHIDYLLDVPAAEIVGVWVWRTAERLEGPLVDWLMAQPGVALLAVGLGASDDRGRTHLLRVTDNERPPTATECASSDAG